MVVFARAAFGLSFLTYGIALAPFVAVLFLTGIAMGVAASGHRPAARAVVGVADLADPDDRLAVRRRLLSGRASCPAGCGRSRRSCRPSYVFEGMRAVVAGRPRAWGALGLGAALALLYLGLACLAFASVYKTAIRTGLIARYSAEFGELTGLARTLSAR